MSRTVKSVIKARARTSVTSSMRLNALKLSNINEVELVKDLEDAFEIEITELDWIYCSTVSDVVRLVHRLRIEQYEELEELEEKS